MLKHNPKLKVLWLRAKKRKDNYLTLDMRYKSSKDFFKGFSDHIKNSTEEKYIK